MGNYAQKLQTLLFHFFHGSLIQLALRRPVHHQTHLSGVHLDFLHQLRDSSGCLHASSGAVADQNRHLHGGQDTAADMLHAGLIIHYHIGVMALQPLDLSLHQTIDKAVTSLSLGSSHHHQVKIILFHHSVLHPHLQIICLAHARGDLHAAVHACALNLLPQFSQRRAGLHAQHLVQIGIGVRVHGQHRSFPGFAKILNQQAAQGGFSHSAFTCHSNHMSHNDFPPFSPAHAGGFFLSAAGSARARPLLTCSVIDYII